MKKKIRNLFLFYRLRQFCNFGSNFDFCRKRGKEGNEGFYLPDTPLGVGQGRMSEALPGGGGGEHYYYEHPLTAATTAMLNISSSANDEPNGTMGYVYEYYKLPPMPQDKDKLAEIWP